MTLCALAVSVSVDQKNRASQVTDISNNNYEQTHTSRRLQLSLHRFRVYPYEADVIDMPTI